MSDASPDRVELLVVSHLAETRKMMESHLRHRFTIATAADEAEALRLLFEGAPDLVIVEYRLSDRSESGRNGLDVVAQAKDIAPRAIYILLVDEIDLGEAVHAKGNGDVDHWISRPWDAHKLCVNLQDARGKLSAR